MMCNVLRDVSLLCVVISFSLGSSTHCVVCDLLCCMCEGSEICTVACHASSYA